MNRYFKKGARVLFQGDSVTDCGRDRSDFNSLGPGYPGLFARLYDTLFPGNDICFINRGVSGDRISNLLERYDDDFVSISPDYVFIEIGVNDTWRNFDSGLYRSPEEFYDLYKQLLTQLRRDLPDAEIILLTPFLLRTMPERYLWHDDLDLKLAATEQLAGEFGLKLLDLQDVLDRAVIWEGFKDKELTEDSVHPTEQGHAVIAYAMADFLGII